ncbi:MAG: TraR/DksA C4-type zinc finger protein [Chloroflexota bacterium]
MTTVEVDLDQIRLYLTAERDDLHRRLGTVVEHVNGGLAFDAQFNPDRSDLADEYAERERDIALLAIEQEQLQQIEAALARINDGTYGICVQCGDPIQLERLEILPYATTCVRCQSHRKIW